MLAHPTLDQLHTLGLHGLAKGFRELEHKPEARGLDHAEWLGLLLEYELTLRRQKQFETRARVAKLRHSASVEDVNYQTPRGLDRALFLKPSACDWIAERRNLLVTGASGLGKSWLACALGHKACRENISVLYTRVPRLLADLAIAHGDARYARLLRSLARIKLLILDDWGPEALTSGQARDMLEIVEDRYDNGSLIITSQVPIDRWHDLIGVPTLADAILDRVVHNAYRIELAGESLRKPHSSPEKTTRARAGWPDPRRSKAVDNGGLRYGAVEGALRPPLPTATHRPSQPGHPSRPSQAQNPRSLDRSVAAQHHHLDPRKRTLGGRLQIGIPAGFRSEIGGRLPFGIGGRLRRNPQARSHPPRHWRFAQ